MDVLRLQRKIKEIIDFVAQRYFYSTLITRISGYL